MKRDVLKNKGGFSLVELMVVFALISIFMTAAIQLMASASRVHNRMDNMAKAQIVADTMLTTIEGEVSSAMNAQVAEGSSTSACFIKDGGQKDTMYFFDQNGNHTKLSVDYKGYLLLDYDNPDDFWHWYLGAEAYMNNKITKLKFEPVLDVGGQPTNVVKVILGLSNSQTGFQFETTKMVKCYNLPATAIEKG